MPFVSGGGGSGVGKLVTLFDSTLAVAAATIDTGAAGVAASASHLLIVMKLRSNAVATTDTCVLTFNGDTGAHYYVASGDFFGTTASAVHAEAAASLSLEAVSAATSTADVYSPLTLLVPSYADGHLKSVNGLAGYRTGNASGNILAKALIGYWDQTAAISQITVTAAAQFVAGSRMTVYGLV